MEWVNAVLQDGIEHPCLHTGRSPTPPLASYQFEDQLTITISSELEQGVGHCVSIHRSATLECRMDLPRQKQMWALL